jgi:hypothetical protein
MRLGMRSAVACGFVNRGTTCNQTVCLRLRPPTPFPLETLIGRLQVCDIAGPTTRGVVLVKQQQQQQQKGAYRFVHCVHSALSLWLTNAQLIIRILSGTANSRSNLTCDLEQDRCKEEPVVLDLLPYQTHQRNNHLSQHGLPRKIRLAIPGLSMLRRVPEGIHGRSFRCWGLWHVGSRVARV